MMYRDGANRNSLKVVVKINNCKCNFHCNWLINVGERDVRFINQWMEFKREHSIHLQPETLVKYVMVIIFLSLNYQKHKKHSQHQENEYKYHSL